MALTTAERTNIIKLVVGMFNAAPGAGYLADLTVSYEANGRSLANLARDLANTAGYKALNPVFQTAAEFASSFLTPLGLQANQVAIDFVTSRFNLGVSKGQIAFEALSALDASTDTNFADAKAIVNNKTTVAEYYSVTKAIAQTNIGSLQSVVSSVTKDAASVSAAQGAIDSGTSGGSGSVFTLATAAETLTGTSGADTFNSADTTLTAADSVDGAAGIDTLNFTNSTAAAAFPSASIKNIEIVNVRATANLTSSDLSTLPGLTNFNADRSTAAAITTVNAGAGVQYGLIGDNATLFGAAENFGYAAGATVATLNLQNGVKSAAATTVTITGTGVTSTVINSSGTANSLNVTATAGTIVVPASSKATTINATANLTTALSTTADTKLTVTGTGVVDLRGINFGSALSATISTIDASAQTAGGTLVQVNAKTTSGLKFIGGAGNDTLGLNITVTNGATVDGGAGTDTLYVGSNSAVVSTATGAIIKNFEVVDIVNASIDLDNLATNNVLAGLRVGGSATVSNINSATAANITIYANANPVLNVKGATTPGQLDTVKIDVNDGSPVVNTITVSNPVLTAVETLNVVATDNVTINSLANAQALTGITFTGAGAISLTTTAIALKPNGVVDASAATGNFTLDATGATANGYTIKGSAGTNVITGGSAPIVVDITKSVAKADQVIITSATNSTASVMQTISGFTNAVTTGDKLDVINTGTITANAAAGTATGVTNLTAAITSGIITFGGTAAATATLQNKIDAAATLAGTTQYNMVAFEHGGNTYVYEQGDTTATYAAGVDLIVQLTGVTGVTALSTTASGATTLFVV